MSPTLTSALHLGAVAMSALFLWKGADWVVEGAARIARRMHISELVIGLTLVAAGTSAPEFAVSIGAALAGQANISVGNIVGSNIFNLGFILGGCAVIRPILSSRALVYRDSTILVLITIALALFIGDLVLARWEGILMMLALVTYIAVLLWRRSPIDLAEQVPEEGDAEGSNARDIVELVLGLVAVVVGSRLLIYGASGMARTFGMSDWQIGVTIVAAGTSAPEVVTSLTAALKGKYGISAGGLIGSDIYNLLGVLGLAATITPMAVVDSGRDSVLLLVAMVGVVFIFLRTGWRVSRLEGVVLLLISGVRWWADMSGISLFSLGS